MEAFGIIKLIFGTTFLGLMMLTGIYNDESFYKVILAVIMTLGLLYGVGQLPYAFLIFIILGITMYTYVQTSSIEDTLFNTLLVFTVCILLGLFGDTDFFKPFKNFKLKEGFYFSPNARRLVSHSMTALQCQNVCANDKHCKFSYYGRNMERGGRGQCWNTHGSDSNQRPYGGKNQGGITWRNKKYTPKPPPPPRPKLECIPVNRIQKMQGNYKRRPWGSTYNSDYYYALNKCKSKSLNKCNSGWGRGRCNLVRKNSQSSYKKLNGHCTGYTSYRRYPENSVYACKRRCNATAGCKGIAFRKGRRYLPPLKDGPCTTYNNKCLDSRDNVNWGYDIYQRK